MTINREAATYRPPTALSLAPLGPAASLRDRAYASLRQAIAETDIYRSREAIRLDEKEVAEALGVSRTPVREAMTLLEQQGFLRTVPRRGVYILRKTKREIVDMIHMWAALESMAARLATLSASAEDLAALRRLFDAFCEAAPSAHVDAYSEANLAFHQSLVELSGSHLLIEAVRNIFVHVRAIRRTTIARGDRASRSIAEHMRIIEALEARDTELAERLVRQHSLDLAAFVEAHCDFLD
ncbi:MAG TPA: GntR family transcriptional regulator [Trinickia sp.]|jgi:DNA-binding GntR family transcriptional regulator|uniref:GntR family transcriptional regulator n=1 Tax=Trinickia sp. TaxID=2571163 RepID=UPI002CBDBACA|nr:GntR family transcriptional regulator [Trinickia sp.]HVW49105.1 GntR family transcriptional regulator [Trinickia sp.]